MRRSKGAVLSLICIALMISLVASKGLSGGVAGWVVWIGASTDLLSHLTTFRPSFVRDLAGYQPHSTLVLYADASTYYLLLTSKPVWSVFPLP
jgi:hypothetical protein